VKILRQKIGFQEQELMYSIPLVQYDGQRIAANFGPGTYYLRPGGRKYAKNAAKLPISDALARSCGFGRIPTTAADVAAERTLRNAAEGPTDPVELLSAIERILDRREAEKRGQTAAALPGMVAVDPLSALKSQFEQVQTMMTFMASLEERAIKTVEMRMGKADVSMGPEDTNVSLWEKLLPKALDIFGSMMQARNAEPARVSSPQVEHQATTKQPPAIAVSQPAQHQEAPAMPTLTPEEQKAIGAAVVMLRPHGATLVQLAGSGMNDLQIIEQLEPWIPAAMVPELANLAAVVGQHGPSVLQAIHPGLAVDRWAILLPKLVSELQEGE
jgi:hypothetical protein